LNKQRKKEGRYTLKGLQENNINLCDIVNSRKFKLGWEMLNDTMEFEKTEKM
jgi:hypothetical protein